MVELQPLRTIADEVLTDIESKTNQSTPAVSVSYNRLVANAVAALSLSNKLHNIDQRKECFPQTATENVGLPLWAALVNRPRIAGIPAELQVTITGTSGTVIGQNSTGPRFKAENGIIYSTKIGGLIQSGTLSATILSTESGSESTLQIGDELNLVTTLVGVDTKATVTAINVTGTDQEDVEDWRAAIIQKAAFPAEIGTVAWFYTQAVSVPGITRAYPYCDQSYPGRVLIYAVADANTDGQPSSAQLADIEAVFTAANKNIMWAYDLLPNGSKRIEAYASPIDEYVLEILVGSPALSATIKTAIETAIANYALTRNPYIKGLSLSDAGTLEAVALSSLIQNTIESNPSETGKFTGVTLSKNGTPSGYFTLSPGRRAKITVIYG